MNKLMILTAGAVALVLAACGGDDDDAAAETTTASATATSEAPTTTAAPTTTTTTTQAPTTTAAPATTAAPTTTPEPTLTREAQIAVADCVDKITGLLGIRITSDLDDGESDQAKAACEDAMIQVDVDLGKGSDLSLHISERLVNLLYLKAQAATEAVQPGSVPNLSDLGVTFDTDAIAWTTTANELVEAHS